MRAELAIQWVEAPINFPLNVGGGLVEVSQTSRRNFERGEGFSRVPFIECPNFSVDDHDSIATNIACVGYPRSTLVAS